MICMSGYTVEANIHGTLLTLYTKRMKREKKQQTRWDDIYRIGLKKRMTGLWMKYWMSTHALEACSFFCGFREPHSSLDSFHPQNLLDQLCA